MKPTLTTKTMQTLKPTNDRLLQVPFVDLTAQYEGLANEINQVITQAIRRTDYILGRDVALFEEEFAAFCETEYAVSVDSGTSALELVLRAYNIGPNDEVITAANTFIATTFAISYTGATPVLVDIDRKTQLIDVSLLEQAITPRTKAIIPVHLFGQCADMDPILEIARRRGLIVIEDACQAHGARYKGKRAGSMGEAAAFSFYPAKNLGAYGDGGAIVTNDKRIEESLKLLRNYGQPQKYHHSMLGYNRRLDTLQAAVLRVKLKHLDEWNAARRRHAALYGRLLATKTDAGASGVIPPTTADYGEAVWHLYVVRSSNRDALQKRLAECGVSTGIHYPVPIHLQPAYNNLGYKKGDFPVTESYADQILSLPMFPELTPEQVRWVVDSV